MWDVFYMKYNVPCEVCDHPNRKEIEICLRDGGAGNNIKEIRTRFNIEKTPHILRHKENHMFETTKEIVKMCNDEYEKIMKNKGIEKKLLSIDVLDAFIEKYKDVLSDVTAKDVLAAIKLKEELLGNVIQKNEVKLTWLDTIPDPEKEEKDD